MFSPVRMSPMNKSKRNQRYEKPYSREVQGTPGGFWFSEQSAIVVHLFLMCFPLFAWSCLEFLGLISSGSTPRKSQIFQLLKLVAFQRLCQKNKESIKKTAKTLQNVRYLLKT